MSSSFFTGCSNKNINIEDENTNTNNSLSIEPRISSGLYKESGNNIASNLDIWDIEEKVFYTFN